MEPTEVRMWLRSFAEYLALHGQIDMSDVDLWVDRYCDHDPDFALLETVSGTDYSDEEED